MPSPQDHWQRVFSTKKETEVSWYEAQPVASIALFKQCNLPKEAAIIDVGCGDGHFIDYLIDNGYSNITALDISEKAIGRLKDRLGYKARSVNWVVSDVLQFKAMSTYDFWHDRASFHFHSEEDAIRNYCFLVQKAVRPKGYQMIATFAQSGPKKCSGLAIAQYNVASLVQLFKPDFSLVTSLEQRHVTPFNTEQDFIFCLMQRV